MRQQQHVVDGFGGLPFQKSELENADIGSELDKLVCLCSLVLRRNFEWSLALYECELFVAFELQVFSSLQWILSLI